MARTFNVYQWAGTKSLVDSGRNIRSLYTAMVHVKKPTRRETFAQAVARLGLTADDIKKKQQQYRLTSSIFGVFFIFGVVYSCLLFYRKDYVTTVMAIAYSMLMFAFFFRESFWYMQIKQRTLGKTVFDWARFLLGKA